MKPEEKTAPRWASPQPVLVFLSSPLCKRHLAANCLDMGEFGGVRAMPLVYEREIRVSILKA